MGGLKGIISRLDYLKSLGVGTIWLNSIYASPNDDNGYGISNYRQIMPGFGTMQDFDEPLRGMHQRGIKLLMDSVSSRPNGKGLSVARASLSINNSRQVG